MYRKLKIVLWCLLSSVTYAQVGIATTTLSLTVPSRTSTNTIITDTSTSTLVNSLVVDGNLRIADVPLALVVTQTQEEKQKVVGGNLEYENVTVTTESLDTKDYKDILVADKNGVVNHVDINDFYAFNLHYTRYLVVTATYEVDGPINRQIVPNSTISIGWLDFCVMYRNLLPAPPFYTGKYVEVRYRPNKKNMKNGVYQDFFVTVNILYDGLAGSAYERIYVNPNKSIGFGAAGYVGNMKDWFQFGKGGSDTFTLQDRTGQRGGARVYRAAFFNGEIKEWLMIDIYMSTHVNPVNNSRYVAVTYWVSSPVKR